ncbi:MAG TPA: hypothetical protein PKE19_03190 [Aestuariivirga sp.]|nr:hypothetical protein [Aestuariivirga sp.]
MMLRRLSPNQIFALVFLAISGVQVLAWNEVWLLMNGSDWSQADWLINNAAGPVRRGIVGSGLIALSDATGITLLWLVVGIQAAITAILFGLVLWLITRMPDLPDRLLLLLVSPAFFVFWSNDFHAIGRKEIIACLAFMTLLVAVYRDRRSLLALVLAAMIFAVAGIAHEANIFFLPFFALAIHLVYGTTSLRRVAHATIAVLTLVAAGTMIYALKYASVKDTSLVCAPLLQRGFLPNICEGAITWLGYDIHYAVDKTRAKFLSLRFPQFLLIYGLILLPFWHFFREGPKGRSLFAAAALSGLFFLPLYVIAVDWGRWINFHVMALVFVILIYLRVHRPTWAFQPLDDKTKNLFLFFSVVIGIHHVAGVPVGGFAFSWAKNYYVREVYQLEVRQIEQSQPVKTAPTLQ